jgi:hypothetical protein
MEGRKVRFTGAVAFYENGTMYRDYPKDQPRYAGYPDAEVDEAWDNLLYAAAVDLPTHEIGRLKDTTWEEPQGGLYRTG